MITLFILGGVALSWAIVDLIVDDDEADESEQVIRTDNGMGEDILGTSQGDYIDGTGLDDSVDGNGGEDTIRGHYGDDTLGGGDGSDYLNGGATTTAL